MLRLAATNGVRRQVFRSPDVLRLGGQRCFAATKEPMKPVVLPGSGSTTASTPPVPGLKIPVTPDLTTHIPKDPKIVTQVPLLPESTSATKSIPPAKVILPPAAPPPLLPKKETHRFRNLLVVLTLLTSLGYGGGIYLSLENDNFHDFFTEYIPFAEPIVLGIEERRFRQRFPNAAPRPAKASERVTVPKKSGATWKVSEQEKKKTDLGKDGPHLSSLKAKNAIEEEVKEDIIVARTAKEKIRAKGRETFTRLAAKTDETNSSLQKIGAAAATTLTNSKDALKDKLPTAAKKEADQTVTIAPESGVEATVTSVKQTPKPKNAADHLTSDPTKGKADAGPLDTINSHDPVLEGLVKIINSVVSLASESDPKGRFEQYVKSAKEEIRSLNNKIKDLKASSGADAGAALKEQELEFTKVASGIVRRMDDQLQAVENRWRKEFEKEREVLADNYQSKLKNELEKTNQLSEQKLRNTLLEQAMEMKKQWVAELKDRVEKERDGRLGKLKELSSNVDDLGKLTNSWTDVLDQNLSIQKLHVALEAVRTSVADPAQPRPFVKELAALKEVSAEDEVVKAAIASINPVAYQKGLSSSSQIIDRFRRVSTEVRKAALLQDDAGVAGHASSWVLSKLLFQKKGLATGDDVESILTRTETYLTEGDLEKAAREMNQLKGWSKTLAGDWLREVRVLLEVQQAVGVIAAQARLQSLRRDT